MNSVRDHLTVGFPHSEIVGSKPARGSPTLIAACYVLHRLSVPRHPRNALMTLDRFLRRDKPNKETVLQRMCVSRYCCLPSPGARIRGLGRRLNGGWITVQKDHDQDCNNPDQEKPIHDDKEPCVTSHTTPSTMSTARKFPLPNG